jgi:hypothetical protein
MIDKKNNDILKKINKYFNEIYFNVLRIKG